MMISAFLHRISWFGLLCIVIMAGGCAVTDQAGLEAAAPEPLIEPIVAASKVDPTGISSDPSPQVIAARSQGKPYPLPNPKLLANEKAAFAAAKPPASPGASPPTSVQALNAEENADKPASSPTSAAETVISQVDRSEVLEKKVAKLEVQSESAGFSRTSQAASLPGVRLKKGVEAIPEEKIPSAVEIIARTKAILPTLASYASYTVSNERVKTSCFPGRLKKILAQVHHRFGKKPEINSGYRSVAYNRRIGGSRGSYHTKCLAADIKVRGVDKYVLAKYIRSLPGRGGVGVYGCKGVVHVDVGPKRNWYYRCRKRRRA